MATTFFKSKNFIVGEIPSTSGPLVVMQKKSLEELLAALRAIVNGETALAQKKTRSFSEFLHKQLPRYASDT